jgi:peptidoglycan/xylan/chitin deacetylase (PgdA/CDA1 family)
MYHGVTDEQTAIPDWCLVGVNDFRGQMEFLHNEYRVLPLGECVQRISSGLPLPDRAVCVTFDDGFRNVLTHAAPILDQYQLPSTVFLVTSLMDSCLPPWPGLLLFALSNTSLPMVHFAGRDWALTKGRAGLDTCERLVGYFKILPGEEREARLDELCAALNGGQPADFSKSPRATVNWDEVAGAARSGLMRFESHTHTHASLSHCAPQEQRKELETSRDIMRARLAVEDLFCYPFGDYSPETTKNVVEMGYRCALTTDAGLNSAAPDIYTLRRVGIGAGMSRARFEAAVAGCCD